MPSLKKAQKSAPAAWVGELQLVKEPVLVWVCVDKIRAQVPAPDLGLREVNSHYIGVYQS